MIIVNLIIFLLIFCGAVYYDRIVAKIKGKEYKRPMTDYEPSKLVVFKSIAMVITIDVIFSFFAFYIGRYVYFNLQPIFKWVLRQPNYTIRIATVLIAISAAQLVKFVTRKINTANNEEDILTVFAIFNFPFMILSPIMAFYIGHVISFYPTK